MSLFLELCYSITRTMSSCITVDTRQFFRLAAVVMAVVLLWRNTTAKDPWILAVALITLCVDGYLWLVRSKECP